MRGFFDQAFSLEMTTDTPGANIFYTLDGSVPCDLTGRFSAAARPYTSPIPITTTTCVRAVAYLSGWVPSRIETHTYIFPEDVRHQATNPTTGAQVVPAGYPASWGSASGDYQVDPDVVDDTGKDKFGGLYAATFTDDLQSGPTVCVVMARDDWFGPTGIYINQAQDGTERACSLEWIEPNGAPGFQVNCAIGMQGGAKHDGGGTSLQRWKVFKLSMRPRFKKALDNGQLTDGPSRLDYPVFPDSPVKSFDTFVLDEVMTNAWNHNSQHMYSSYFQDQYVSDLHNAMGGYSPHGRFAHLYINGLYWGMYYVHERPDDAWAAEVFGGTKEEYDCLKHSTGRVVNNGLGGTAVANFNAMVAAASAVAADPTNAAKYDALRKQLDVDNFITDLLAHWFALNWDWPEKNWYATHRSPEGPWRFHVWDAEHSLEYWNSGQNVLGLSVSSIHDKLKANADYRMRFADLVHRFFFNGGAMTYASTARLHAARMAELHHLIVGESARWGDTRSSFPHTRQDWLDYHSHVLSDWIKPRSEQVVLNWLKTAGLYPSVGAPVFNVNNTVQHGGHVKSTDRLTMTLPQGTTGKIYYSLDGTDPRVPSAGSTPSAPEITLVAGNAAKRVLVPTAAINDAWKGGAVFDDSGWTAVTASPGGVGFDTNPTGGGDYRPYVSLDLDSSMRSKNGSCYIRIPFTVDAADVASLGSLTLKMLYDDGFVAYLNGVELHRATFTGTPAWNSMASTSHAGLTLTTFDVSGLLGEIRAGSNILAIQGMNSSKASDDLLILAELVTTKATSPGTSNLPPGVLEYKGALTLSRSATLKARTQSGSTWSALNEAVYGVGPVAAGLRISEIMYHPADPNTEFIELTNVAPEAVNLSLVRFAKGIDFTFGDVVLQPGAAVVIAKDRDVFTAKYGQGPIVAGIYTGSLDNAGERIRLEDAAGTLIADFEYKDGWYKTTDGQGYSLVVKTPETADPGALSDKASWRASSAIGGSPGLAE